MQRLPPAKQRCCSALSGSSWPDVGQRMCWAAAWGLAAVSCMPHLVGSQGTHLGTVVSAHQEMTRLLDASSTEQVSGFISSTCSGVKYHSPKHSDLGKHLTVGFPQ